MVIAVSTSLLTVLAVAVIVAVGVIVCWRISTRNRCNIILSSSLLSSSYIIIAFLLYTGISQYIVKIGGLGDNTFQLSSLCMAS